MAKWTTTTLNTGLTVQQCAQTFKDTGEQALGGGGATANSFLSKMRGGLQGFYTPQSSGDNPFGQFDEADFAVGVAIPKFVNNDKPRNIQMEVRDRETHREVVLAANRPAQSLLPNFVAAFRAADPSARGN